MTRWSAALAGCIGASALFALPAVAGPTGAHGAAPPSASSPLFFPTVFRQEMPRGTERPALSMPERREGNALASAPVRRFVPIVPFAAFGTPYGFGRFGYEGPYAANGCPNLAFGQPGYGPSFYAQPLLMSDENPGDPFSRPCFNSPFTAQPSDARKTLSPAHNKDALYGPGYHPNADLYQ